jgi:glycosyltransferase involved in cell wall biosynthesis
VSFSGIVPRAPGCPVIAVLANPVPYADRRQIASRVRRGAIARTLRGAAATYVPTEGMRRLVGDPALKVVPLGVDHEIFRPRGDGEGGSELLCVGDFYDHKRHALLMEAWHLLPEPRPRLRMIGNPLVDPQTFAAVAAAADDDRIVIAGHVGLATLTKAYAHARALVVPSELESFGMPLVEALASGVPAVVRDDAVLRETAGPGCLPVPDDTPAAWAQAMQRLISDDELHASLRAAGIEHARRYSWETMATQIVADARRFAR